MRPNLKEHRHHKIKSHYGSRDYYRYYKQQGGTLDYLTFSGILRDYNVGSHDYIISKNYRYRLPKRMGIITITKYKNYVTFENGELKTNLPIDWNATLNLWEADEQAKANKVILRVENTHSNRYTFKLRYLKSQANYRNKTVYSMNFNRTLKNKLTKAIHNGFDTMATTYTF